MDRGTAVVVYFLDVFPGLSLEHEISYGWVEMFDMSIVWRMVGSVLPKV